MPKRRLFEARRLDIKRDARASPRLTQAPRLRVAYLAIRFLLCRRESLNTSVAQKTLLPWRSNSANRRPISLMQEFDRQRSIEEEKGKKKKRKRKRRRRGGGEVPRAAVAATPPGGRRRPRCPSAIAAHAALAPRSGGLTMAGSMKLQPDDGSRYSLGIGPSSDDAVGSHRKFARRFAEGIEKLARNAKGDRREEDRRACRKIAGVCGTQSVDQRADQRKSQAEIRKVEGTTFAEIPTGNERRLDCPYHRIRATGNNFRRVNRPGGG
ncbi:hypothetical protein GW17_00037229 [Ensete ventricosum]|nr:hypothetical protein GW17_00037229 [Ensete ventricosum]